MSYYHIHRAVQLYEYDRTTVQLYVLDLDLASTQLTASQVIIRSARQRAHTELSDFERRKLRQSVNSSPNRAPVKA
jgi:hypothetical protein